MGNGYQVNSPHDEIFVDTETLWVCANQIKRVLSRAQSVEKRLDDAFRIIGEPGFMRVCEMYLREGNETGLKQCIRYLTETAKAFEEAETARS